MSINFDELERLERLRADGALSDAEFQREKERVLNRRPAAFRPRGKVIATIAIVAVIIFALSIVALLRLGPSNPPPTTSPAPVATASDTTSADAPVAEPSSAPSPAAGQAADSASPSETAATQGDTIAQSKPGRCKLVVKGTTYIDGTCPVELDPDGSFSINRDQGGSGYFAMLQRDGASAKGYWNGSPDSTHAQDELGDMTRKGACWQNDTAQLCAWGP